MQPKLVSGEQRASLLLHFEPWLAISSRVGLAASVAELNLENRATRIAPGQLLQVQYLDSTEAICLVFDTLEPPQLNALTVEGRINSTYYFARSNQEAWMPKLLTRGRAVARNLQARESQGLGLGPQTRAEIDAWVQKVLNVSKGN